MKFISKKLLPLVLIAIAIFFHLPSLSAQTITTVKVAKLNNPKVVVHKKGCYYRSGGVWYVKKKKSYVKVIPPVGVRVHTLPRGYKVVSVRGRKYYSCRGVYYKKSGRNYVVVRV